MSRPMLAIGCGNHKWIMHASDPTVSHACQVAKLRMHSWRMAAPSVMFCTHQVRSGLLSASRLVGASLAHGACHKQAQAGVLLHILLGRWLHKRIHVVKLYRASPRRRAEQESQRVLVHDQCAGSNRPCRFE